MAERDSRAHKMWKAAKEFGKNSFETFDLKKSKILILLYQGGKSP